MKIGALVVGLGRVGMGYDLQDQSDTHVRSHARAFSTHPAFQLLGGADVARDARETFTRCYGTPAFEDVDVALERLRPEIVAIAVPTALHAVTIRAVLRHSGIRAICCEKPLSDNLSEAQAMVQVCEDRRVPLFVNYMRRSDPGVIEIKRRLDEGEICGPIKGVAWYSKGLIHNGSHVINLLEFWLGDVLDVRVIAGGRLWDGRDPEPNLFLTFVRGTVVLMAATEECFSHLSVEIIACNGRLRYDSGGRRIDWQPTHGDPQFAGYTTLAQTEQIESGLSRYQWHVANELSRSLAGSEANVCSGAQALRTLETIHLSLAHL